MSPTLLAAISRWQSPFLGHLPKTERFIAGHLPDLELLVGRFDGADVLPTWIDAVFCSAVPEWAERADLYYCGRGDSLADCRLPAEVAELDERIRSYLEHLLVVLESARTSAELQSLSLETAIDLTLAEVGIVPASWSGGARAFPSTEPVTAVDLEEQVGGSLLDLRTGREWLLFPAQLRLTWSMAREQLRNLRKQDPLWRIPELDEMWRLAAAWPRSNPTPQGWFWTGNRGVVHRDLTGFALESSRSRSCVSFEGARARSWLENGSLRLALVRDREGWVASPSEVG